MYTMMKPVTGGSMPGVSFKIKIFYHHVFLLLNIIPLICIQFQDFPMNNASDNGPLGPMGPNTMNSVLNGEGLDGMKNSPGPGGPGTPREDSGSGMGDYNLAGFGGAGENVIGLDLY